VRSERARKYREEAARLRQEADNAKHPETRQQLLDIAAQYERLTASTERLLNQIGPLPPGRLDDLSVGGEQP